jgi:RHS repeat-associated protein
MFADRGFTGHEHLDAFGLIDMNGRVYDPILGRFLSPDKYVQAPGFTQSLNWYSYCLNNPLIFTDPSGNTWLSQFGDWISGGFNNLRTWMNNNPMQFGLVYGDNGTIPFISFPVKGNTNLSVGYNITTGQPGIGNNSSGFTNFYYPFHKTITPEEIGGDAYNAVRTPFNMNEWQAANGGGYKDVTTAFDAQLEKTMAYFSISRDWFDINYPKGGLGKEIDRMMFFRSRVNDNAVFDIKRTAFSRANLGAEYGIYKGQEFRYDDFGNYNYGVAAKYFGLTLDRALLGAGLNQISKFNPDFGNPGGYFDHSQDTEMIIRGYYHKW